MTMSVFLFVKRAMQVMMVLIAPVFMESRECDDTAAALPAADVEFAGVTWILDCVVAHGVLFIPAGIHASLINA